MSIARRIDQLEQADEQRFRAAVEGFRTAWFAMIADPAQRARDAAAMAAAGFKWDTLAAIEAWEKTCPQAEQEQSKAYDDAVFSLVPTPRDPATIRAALAGVAPYLDLATLQTAFAGHHALLGEAITQLAEEEGLTADQRERATDLAWYGLPH